MAGRRTLVVDADWKMRKLVRTNLEAQGLDVAEAAAGPQCLEELRRHACDLVLIDADLPGGNGWNLVAELRRTLEAHDLPIIVFVAEPARSRLLGRFQRVSTLVKPFSAADLVACVECALVGAADHGLRTADY